jgi:carbon storage regulator
MLVLSRKVGERVLIGDSIWVTVVRLDGDRVRLGIEAPRHVAVLRQELATRNGARPQVDEHGPLAGSLRNADPCLASCF